jgi:hypothetical protein
MESLLHRLDALEKLIQESLKEIQAIKEEITKSANTSRTNVEVEAQLLYYHSELRTNGRS